MLSQTSPVTGTTTYAYDLAGDLLSTTDANHATTTRTYDALGRLLTATSTVSGGATETVTWGYDGGAGTFSVGRLSIMTDLAGTTNYMYDRRGSLVAESRTSGSFAMTTSFLHDANGNRTSLHYPSGLTVDYTYDFANRPLSLSSGGITYVSGATYLPFGPEVSVDFANGTRQLRTYDARYRIQRNALASPSGVPIADYSYTEDAAGNITSIHDLVDPGYNRDFGYDDLYRLTVANTGPALWGTGSYHYDAMGNMVARDIGGVVEVDPNNPLLTRAPKFSAHTDSLPAPGSIHETYAYAGTTSKLGTITSGGLDHPLTYDAAGNELRYFDDRTYSARNLMTSIAEPSEDGKPHTINYGYDGRGVRLIRSEGTSGYAAPFATRYYVYSPELQLLAVSDEGPNVWGKTAISHMVPPMKHEIVWFNGRPIAEFLNQSLVRYTFTDHLGTPILQTDSNATVTWRAEYEPYGDIFLLRNGTAGEQMLRFPGQEYERKWEGVEERYNIHRWYRSGWGRYVQGDPAALAGGLNLYSYAVGNPTRYFDPNGLCKVELRFSPVGPTSVHAYHAYITTTDSSGTDFFRGGPSATGGGASGASGGASSGSCCRSGNSNSSNSSSPGSGRGGPGQNNGGYGPIVGTSGPYGPGTVDYPRAGEIQPSPILLVDDGLMCLCDTCFQKVLDDIQSRQIPYNPFLWNSNSVVHELLQRCHFDSSLPPYRVPAWENKLPGAP